MIEEQLTCFICKSYRGKQNGSVVECTCNKCTLHETVIAKTIPQTAKIAQTFEQSNGGTINTFHLYNLLRKTEWQCTFNK